MEVICGTRYRRVHQGGALRPLPRGGGRGGRRVRHRPGIEELNPPLGRPQPLEDHVPALLLGPLGLLRGELLEPLAAPLAVDSLPGFGAGEVSGQDLSAQRAAALLDLKAGQRVLDACAAPGLDHRGRQVSSAEVHASFCGALADGIATLVSAREFAAAPAQA